MARNGLTDRMVKQARTPGVLIDGGGLRLKITANPSTGDIRKSWVLRVTVKGGAVREVGLGSADTLPLQQARVRAAEMRQQARDGIDPLAHRAAARAAKAAEAARAMSFRECADAYIAAHRPTWKNEKHARQWPATLAAYAFPVFGDAAVGAIDQAMIMKVLDPIWSTKTETAARLRGRIEAVLDWATVRGYRQGENPARWRGHLERALPPRAKTQRVQHHPALPYQDLPAFMADLRALEGVSARALELCILTATRTSEALNARWSEIDLDGAVWTIPAERMKMGKAHRIPLAPQAVTLLREASITKSSDGWVFPGARAGRPLSDMALLMMLRRMKRTDVTTHGFRSTFRDWAAERTNFAREVAEAALAHAVGDKVEAAYRRSDLFEKRRRLMDAWATYCASPAVAAKVISIRQGHD
jgi:integrase